MQVLMPNKTAEDISLSTSDKTSVGAKIAELNYTATILGDRITELNGEVDNLIANSTDSALSSTSANPVQNKVITTRLNDITGSLANINQNVSDAFEVVWQQIDQKAEVTHNHSADNITSGVLPVARGGTGFETLEELREELGITSGGSAASGMIREFDSTTISVSSYTTATSLSKLYTVTWSGASADHTFIFDYRSIMRKGTIKQFVPISTDKYITATYNSNGNITFKLGGNAPTGAITHICGFY